MIGAQPAGDRPLGSYLADRSGGPTVLRIVLGTQLRRLREASGVSRQLAANAIRASHAKISRLELGRVGFKERDVADLLTLYGVHAAEERAEFLALARRANEPGWWNKYSDVLPSWFELHVGLEESASVIRTYEVQFVPGLMQTMDYAQAVVRLGHPTASENEIERRVSLRMTRQQLLTQPDPPKLWAVVDEAVLRRPIGGTEVMRGQLEQLQKITELPNVTLQIVPFGLGGHAAAGGQFTILRFLQPDLPDVVYLEQLTSALYLDKTEEIDHYMEVMDRLCVEATSQDDTHKFLDGVIAEL